jgi:acyl-CoA synthetase (AMP-forming)/AMP-acid ligase II
MLLHEVIELAAAREPDGLALLDGDRSWTFRELAADVDAVAAALAAVSSPGERVAILSTNRAEHVVAYYAAPKAGTVLAMVSWRLHPEEWAATLEHAGASVVLAESALIERLAPRLADVPSVRLVVALDRSAPAVELPPGVALTTLEALVADGGAPTSPPPADVEAGDVAWIIHTSGTTGRPKGAMLTHRSLLAAAVGTALARPVADDDVYCFPFPLCHVAGYNVVVFHLHARPVVLLDRFEVTTFLRAVEVHRVTTASLAPTMLAMVLDHPDLDGADLSSLRAVGYGASAISAGLLRRVSDRLGCDLSQGYGMTELSGNAVFLDAAAHRRAVAGEDRLLGAAGRPSPMVAVRIVDDDGLPLPAGEVGEIAVRGDQVCAGYWRDPEATRAARTRDGWFRTGDLGRIDADGWLHVVDRKKDVIVSGGENVASREVEDVLAEHGAVREAAVIGVPDDRWGERVAAVVARRPGQDVTAEDLVAHVREHLAGFKVPRLVAFVDELPKNASGKVQKATLRDRARDLFG